MRIDQEAYSVEEGNRFYRKFSKVLVKKYNAKPINSLDTGSWGADLKIVVPGTEGQGVVLVSSSRNHVSGWFVPTYDGAKIKIGSKRWQKLAWEDGEWDFDQPKLFKKINEEILKVKGEYIAANAEKAEMEKSRRTIAAELKIDESVIHMRTPFVALLRFEWGHLVIGHDPDKPLRYRLIEICLSKNRDCRLSSLQLVQIIDTLSSILGEKP